MRKAVFTVLISALVGAISLDAAALDTTISRRLVVDTTLGHFSLGTMEVTALGANGDHCDYLAAITHPTNPNDVVLCVLQERRTAFAPSCIHNETEDVATIIEAGTSTSGGGSQCAGFNIKGESFDDVTLLLTESPCGCLQGIEIIHQAGGVPMIYPVRGD